MPAPRFAGQTRLDEQNKGGGRRGSSEDDLPLPLNRAPDLGDGRGLNPSPDEHRPAAIAVLRTVHGSTTRRAGRDSKGVVVRRTSSQAGCSRRASSRNDSDGYRSRSRAISRSFGGSEPRPPRRSRRRTARICSWAGAARADEVGVVRVREPVRARLRRAHHDLLLEHEHGVARASRRERVGDRLGPLRVRDRVTSLVEDASCTPARSATPATNSAPSTVASASRGAATAARRACRRRAARRAGRRPAARAGDDALRRPLERRASADDACLVEHLAAPARALRHAAGSESPGRRRAAGRSGSPTSRRARGAG